MKVSSWKVSIYDIFAYFAFNENFRLLQLYAADKCSK